MNFPGEELVSAAIDNLSAGLIKKMDESEARRTREFTLKLRELEFYKTNYDKELRDIFDYWFEVVRITHIKDNPNLTETERAKHAKRYNELISIDKIAKYKMNTLKYGGKETGRVFAIENKLHQEEYSDQPKAVGLYMWCSILAVLKRDILGQEIDTTDIIQVLVTDYDKNEELILTAKEYILEVYKKTYNSEPYWI